MTATQVLEERLSNRLARTLVDSERRAKHPGNQVAILDRGQVHEPDPIWICIKGPVGHFERQTSLARAANRGKAHESLRGEKPLELRQLTPATYKRRQLEGEVVSLMPVGRVGHRADRFVMRDPRCDLRARAETKLVEDLLDMPLRRPAGDEQPCCNVAIGQPSPHEAGNLQLAGCKPEIELPAHPLNPTPV